MEKRRTASISFSKGIDKASLPFDANPARAIEELNYVYRDGKVQKRYGVEQLLAATAISYYYEGAMKTNSIEFNGLWCFKASDNREHIIAHIGKQLFEISQSSSGKWSADLIYKNIVNTGETYGNQKITYELENFKTSAFVGNKQLYVLGGKKFLVLRWNPVFHRMIVLAVSEDQTTYVPTTTISITARNAKASGRASLDQVNLMTQLRKNMLLSGVEINGEVYSKESFGYVYQLDSPIYNKPNDAWITDITKVKIKRRKAPNIYAIDTEIGVHSSVPVSSFPNGCFDYSSYEAVRIVAKVKSKYRKLVLKRNRPITIENLVGSSGSFDFVVQCGYYDEENGKKVFRIVTESTTFHKNLEDFISYATGRWLEQQSGKWESHSSPDGKYFFSVEATGIDGGINGISDPGETRMVCGIAVKTSGGYEKAIVTIPIKVVWEVFDDDGDESDLNLVPIQISNSITTSIDMETFSVAGVSDYLLVKEEDAAEAREADMYGYFSSGVTAKYDRINDTYRFFLEFSGYNGDFNFEVFGSIRNAVEGNNATPGTLPTKAAEVMLLSNHIPPVDGESNIEVTFPCFVEGASDKIDKCRIGFLFGNANAKNRLFVSGNPDLPNCDWHTSARNSYIEGKAAMESNGDFSYFGDMDYCFYGQTDNAVMGYDHVATDKMVVIKSKSKVEPTNYFRTSAIIQAIDASGNAIRGIDGSYVQGESFPLATGNIGVGAMNFKSIVNLNGDTLFISSENTIVGLDIAGQLGDSQRISNSRSRLIDPELKELDLSDAVLWTDNNNLFLFTDQASYVTNYHTFDGDIAQYEWFKIDVKGVRCAIDIGGAMYFGTGNGGFYRFEKDQYHDCDKLFIAVGGTLYGQDKITYNSALNSKLDEDAELLFKPAFENPAISLFRKVALIANSAINGCDLLIDENDTHILRIVALDGEGNHDAARHAELVEELASKGDFYLNHLDGEESFRTTREVPGIMISIPYRKYTLHLTDDAEDTYTATDDLGRQVDFEMFEEVVLCKPLDGIYKITDLNKTNSTFKIKQNGRDVDIVLYASQDMSVLSFPSEIHKTKPVKSYFISAPAILGDISYRKTIWAWTLSAFKEANDLKVCQATNEEHLEAMKELAITERTPIGFDFANLSFAKVDFEKSVIPRKYTYIRPLSVPFISFGFKSENDENSILSSVSIVYTIPMLSKGS